MHDRAFMTSFTYSTTALTHAIAITYVLQNGSLNDGLQLWKSNLDKHFSGVQDCMICFSIIHTANYSLPKLACKTCQNKFHSACLVSASSVLIMTNSMCWFNG